MNISKKREENAPRRMKGRERVKERPREGPGDKVYRVPAGVSGEGVLGGEGGSGFTTISSSFTVESTIGEVGGEDSRV